MILKFQNCNIGGFQDLQIFKSQDTKVQKLQSF